jgi:hypothetical protein
MVTDAALKHLKPKDKIYKVTDRDGMYVLVKPYRETADTVRDGADHDAGM